MNIVLETLNEKLKQVAVKCHEAETAQLNKRVEKANLAFGKVLEQHPEVKIVAGYDAIKFEVEPHRDILTLYRRSRFNSEAEYYLSTYATTIDNEFEFKRLIFNGKVADILLIALDDIGRYIFEDEELDAKRVELLKERFALEKAINQQEFLAKEKAKQENLKKFESGEVIEFNQKVEFKASRSSRDIWSRVVKMQMLHANANKSRFDIQLTMKDWMGEELKTFKVTNIMRKYVESHLEIYQSKIANS